jgi:hypothetical protein
MTEIDNQWVAGEWGLGIVALDRDDHVTHIIVRTQPADASWERQRDLPGELRAALAVRAWVETVWITPDGRLFFIEPHDEKDLAALGRRVEELLGGPRFDQSSLFDESVERRRNNDRYEREVVEYLPIYWWFLADPDSDAIVLGPDPAAPMAWKETPTEARQRLHLLGARGGFIYSVLASERDPKGAWRLTDEDSEPLGDDALARRVVEKVKGREAELVRDGARPRPTWEQLRDMPPPPEA